ncbi:MAG: GntR family transcriptional regulator [Rhodospirillaceae bacterium]|nr:GntR family transcriptional regulator [Rhodospirillaceae bacterium]MDE0617628.1 GntR family transcriptional regulator [Rhodospirillaceae bacterium]
MRQPFYRNIAHQIEARIAAGDYAPGTSLPSEARLEREFHVSRITIRKALGLLKHRGILYSRSGAGTHVRASISDPTSMRATGSLEDLSYYAAETAYQAVDRRLVVPPSEIAATLDIPEDEHVLCFRGIRSKGDTTKIAFEEIYVPEPLGRAIDNAGLGSRTLFSIIEEVNCLAIAEARQTITAVTVPAAVARHLGIARRTPMLRVTRAYMVASGQTVEVAVSYYNAAMFQYVMTLFPA